MDNDLTFPPMHTSYIIYIPPSLPYLKETACEAQGRCRNRSLDTAKSVDGLYFRPILPLPDTQELALESHRKAPSVISLAASTFPTPLTTNCTTNSQISASVKRRQPTRQPSHPPSKRQRIQPLKLLHFKSSLTAFPTPTGAERYDDTIIAESEAGSEGSEEEEAFYAGAVDSGEGGTLEATRTGGEVWDRTEVTERSRAEKFGWDHTTIPFSHPRSIQATSESLQTNTAETSTNDTTRTATPSASFPSTNPDSRSILIPDLLIPNLSNLPTLQSLLRPSTGPHQPVQPVQSRKPPTTTTSSVSLLVAVLSISPIRFLPTRFPLPPRGTRGSKFRFADAAENRDDGRNMGLNQGKTRFCEITVGQPGGEVGESTVGVVGIWGEKTDLVGEEGVRVGDVVFLENLSHKVSIHPITKHPIGTLSTTHLSTTKILSRTQPRYLYPLAGPTTCSTCDLLAKGISKERRVCNKHTHLIFPEDKRYIMDERLADTIPGLGKVVRLGRWCKGVVG